MVSTYSFMTVSIEAISLSLPKNRDLLFEPSQLDILTLSAYIVNYNISGIVIRNDIDLPIILIRRTRLDRVLEYEVEGYFPVAIKHAIIVDKSPKKAPSSL